METSSACRIITAATLRSLRRHTCIEWISPISFISNFPPHALSFKNIHSQKVKAFRIRFTFSSIVQKQQIQATIPSKNKSQKNFKSHLKIQPYSHASVESRGRSEVLLLPSPILSWSRDYDLCPPSITFEDPPLLLRVTHPLPQLPNTVLSRPIPSTSQFVQGWIWLPFFIT